MRKLFRNDLYILAFLVIGLLILAVIAWTVA